MITVIQACKKKETIYQKDIVNFRGVIEVLTPEGYRPSRQRNIAVSAAKGSIVLFLDDDSHITQKTIDRYIAFFKNSHHQVIGGPAIIREKSVFQYILTSFVGVGASRARYSALGQKRLTSEHELILCNLAIRKKCFMSLKGFNENLYPWEENDFLERAKALNISLYYDPHLITTRGMTQKTHIFLKKVFNYAEGRGKMLAFNRIQYLVALFFLPTLFLIHLRPIQYLFFCYFMIVFADSLKFGLSAFLNTKKVLILFLTHTTYSLGLWKGLYSYLFFKKRFRHLSYSRN